MSTLKTTKMAVTAQELAVARQALEALKLTPPTPPPETITLVSAVGELAIMIRELSKAGYSYEQIATCIKLGGIQMDAPKLRRYLATCDKKLTTKARGKKVVPTMERTPKQTEQTQQTVVQGTTPTSAAPQTKPTPGPSAVPTAPAVVLPTFRPATAVNANPPTPSALALNVTSTYPHRNVPPASATNQTVTTPSISRPQNAASPGASASSSAPKTSDGSGRSASEGRASDPSRTAQKLEEMVLQRQASIALREQASASASAAQAKSQTEGSAPKNPGTLF